MDCQFENLHYYLSEVKHNYGSNIHIISDPYLLTFLARLCFKDTIQPEINRLIGIIYANLVRIVLNNEFPHAYAEIQTRMIQYNPEAVLKGNLIDHNTKVVVSCMARSETVQI